MKHLLKLILFLFIFIPLCAQVPISGDYDSEYFTIKENCGNFVLGAQIPPDLLKKLYEDGELIYEKLFSDGEVAFRRIKFHSIIIGFFPSDNIIWEIRVSENVFSTNRGVMIGQSISEVNRRYDEKLFLFDNSAQKSIYWLTSSDPIDHYVSRTYLIEFIFNKKGNLEELILRIMSGAL